MTFGFFSGNFKEYMDDGIIKLTSAVYKLLEFFPESDPIKNRAKEKALQIAEGIDVFENVKTLLGFLQIAKNQGWLNGANYLAVSAGYENIKNNIKTEKKPVEKKTQEPDKITAKQGPPSYKTTARQSQILDFLQKNGQAQVMDVQKILKVTKRTIRRDMDELLKLRKVERVGTFNQVFYKLIGQVLEG